MSKSDLNEVAQTIVKTNRAQRHRSKFFSFLIKHSFVESRELSITALVVSEISDERTVIVS